MGKDINEYFEQSDLKEVKDLLKSLDLKVESEEVEPEVSHQTFYNTFSRPDKEEKSPGERQKILQKALIECLEKDQKITFFWDVDPTSTMIQVLIDGQAWSPPPIKNMETLLANELENTLHFPHKNENGYSKGNGQLYLNSTKQVVLVYTSEAEYYVKEQLADADLWTRVDLPDYIIANRFFENTLSEAVTFDKVRRGFNAEISIDKNETKFDFYFLPALEISTTTEEELASLLLEKVDKMALGRHQYDFSNIQYLPNFSLNGQISSEKIAILNLEVDYMIFEKQEGDVVLFDFLSN